MCQFDGHATHLFFGVLDSDLEQTMVGRRRGAAESDGAACLNLQMQSGSFQSVRHAELDLVVGRLQAADARKQVAQAAFKVRLLTQVDFGAFALDHGFHGSVTGPEVGAAQGADTRDFH